jgi:hypothetical protein
LARPATAFCSTKHSGNPRARAASAAGTVTRPPKPTTASTCWRRSSLIADGTATRLRSQDRDRQARVEPSAASANTVCGTPARSRNIVSTARPRVSRCTRWPWLENSSASARAGTRCPPVPPAAIKMFTLPTLSAWGC